MDIGEDPSLCDGDIRQQLVQLLVVADGQLDVAGSDALLLVVAAGVSCQLQDLGTQVLSSPFRVVRSNCVSANSGGHGTKRREKNDGWSRAYGTFMYRLVLAP